MKKQISNTQMVRFFEIMEANEAGGLTGMDISLSREAIVAYQLGTFLDFPVEIFKISHQNDGMMNIKITDGSYFPFTQPENFPEAMFEEKVQWLLDQFNDEWKDKYLPLGKHNNWRDLKFSKVVETALAHESLLFKSLKLRRFVYGRNMTESFKVTYNLTPESKFGGVDVQLYSTGNIAFVGTSKMIPKFEEDEGLWEILNERMATLKIHSDYGVVAGYYIQEKTMV